MKTNLRKDIGCLHCRQPISIKERIWMARDLVWQESGYPFRSRRIFCSLHVVCLEQAIQRKLTQEDFLLTPEKGFERLLSHKINLN